MRAPDDPITPASVRGWAIALTFNATLIGWAAASDNLVDGIVPLCVQAIMAWMFAGDLLNNWPDRRELREAADLLAEVLAEHGPMECVRDCGCSACCAARWLEYADV